MTKSASLSLLLSLAFVGVVRSATEPAPREPAQRETALRDPSALGEVFESRVAGIEFRPPAGGTLVRQVNSGDVVRFVYTDRNWDLRLKMVHLAKPTPLSFEPTGNLGGGLLQMQADQLKDSNPSADVLVQEVREIASTKIGFIAARYNTGVDRALAQQAIIRADDNQTFYVLQFVTPGQPLADEGRGVDIHEADAKSAFDAVLPTVKLLDRDTLKQEQDQRLFRTRELFATWDEKRIESILIPEQYLRVQRDGKDVGYLHVTERTAEHSGHVGAEVVLQSHVEGEMKQQANDAAPVSPTGEVVPMPAAAVAAPAMVEQTRPPKLDRVAKLFVTYDRMHEDWSIVTTNDDGRFGPTTTSELGNADKEIRHVLDRQAVKDHEVGDEKDKSQPPVRKTERYTLSVNTYAKVGSAGAPVTRQLPVFYLPQALGHLLPRLVSLNDPSSPRSYMFATYVNDQREVMSRYFDVQREQEVTIDGRHVRAIPMLDRIGVQGSATTHYMSRDGIWLGSVNDDAKIAVLPSDEAEIKRLWKDAKFDDAAVPTDGKVR